MKIIDLIMLSAVEKTKNTHYNENSGTESVQECGKNKNGMITWRNMAVEKWLPNTIQKRIIKYLP
jgi:hypothetical protein